MLSEEMLRKHYLEDGMTQKEIAKKYGVSQAAVGKWSKKYGIKTRKRPGRVKRLPADEVVVAHYLEGMTQEEIGAKYGVAHTCVGIVLRRHEVSMRGSADYAEVIDEPVLRRLYLDEKMTYQEIAKKLGKCVHVVQRNIKLYGIQARPSYNSLGKSCSVEAAKKISEALKGKEKSADHRKKLSDARKGSNNPNFGKPARHTKRCWYVCPDGQTVSMRSNWEVAYAEWLNGKIVKWMYEPKTFILSDGSAYTPDFYLSDSDEYVEVKGWFRDEHKEKIRLFRESYPTCKLIIADKKYLEGLGIDLKQKFISTRPKFPCEHCGKDFYRIYKSQRMCSSLCRNRYIAAHRGKKD